MFVPLLSLRILAGFSAYLSESFDPWNDGPQVAIAETAALDRSYLDSGQRVVAHGMRDVVGDDVATTMLLGPITANQVFKPHGAVDGVLGLHFPVLAPELDGVAAGLDVLLDAVESQARLDRIFTLALTEDGGELQVGGVDAETVVNGTLQWHDASHSRTRYAVNIERVRMGNTELLFLQDGLDGVPAALDSGSACLGFPGSDSAYTNQSSLYHAFQIAYQGNRVTRPQLTVTIGGTDYALPFDAYVRDGKPCVTESPDIAVLGLPFLRTVAVVHDIDRDVPRVGLARTRPGWKPRRKPTHARSLAVLPVAAHDDGEYYTAKIEVGTPPQSLSVVIDTAFPVCLLMKQRESTAGGLMLIFWLLVLSIPAGIAYYLYDNQDQLFSRDQILWMRGQYQRVAGGPANPWDEPEDEYADEERGGAYAAMPEETTIRELPREAVTQVAKSALDSQTSEDDGDVPPLHRDAEATEDEPAVDPTTFFEPVTDDSDEEPPADDDDGDDLGAFADDTEATDEELRRSALFPSYGPLD